LDPNRVRARGAIVAWRDDGQMFSSTVGGPPAFDGWVAKCVRGARTFG